MHCLVKQRRRTARQLPIRHCSPVAEAVMTEIRAMPDASRSRLTPAAPACRRYARTQKKPATAEAIAGFFACL